MVLPWYFFLQALKSARMEPTLAGNAMSYLWVSVVGFLGVLWFALRAHSNAWRLNKRLPPGSMGWPLIGEVVPYLKSSRSSRPFEFAKQRQEKYGGVFKTHLLTGKTVMITDPEGVKFVLQNEGTLFASSYPLSLRNVMGTYAIIRQHGEMQKRMHAIIGRFTNSTQLKQYLTREVEILTKQAMSTWSRGQKMFLQDEAQKITHNILAKQLLGVGPGKVSEMIFEEYQKLMSGIISLPLMIPGTPYYTAMKAREKLIEIMSEMVATRREHPGIEHKDVLQTLIEERREGESDDIIYDNILNCMAAGEGVPSTIMTLAAKNISECPEALKQLREENLAIRKGKNPSEGLSWNDYLSLEFTQDVINETLRLANGAHGVMREALQDVEYRGYTIPKGWTVFPYFLTIHFDEKMYKDPTKFHPWRWREKSIPSTYFTPLGGGIRICPGQELGRLQTAVFLHYLVTQFRWEAEPDVVINFPRVQTKNRFPIVLSAQA